MLAFDNRFAHELPADPERRPQRRQVQGAAFSYVEPTPVSAPKLIACSREVAEQLGLSEAELASPEFLAAFSGNRLYPGMEPIATNYGGHQFGNWAGQLGDGRAISLGEVITPGGKRLELQLKGAGPTPYSRSADGRAVLRSSVREFLCSEAMHHLGIPTTRALSLIATGDAVMRDMLYDGHPAFEPGAIVCRVAPSFIRFGHFELPTSRGDTDLTARLLDFTIARDFPELQGDTQTKRATFFDEVLRRTARVVAHWMRVGFVHGVLNTDNMSVLGLTIDYGPYGFLDNFDPGWTPNTTDAQMRRYRYGQQPQVAHWNLVCLARAIAPLFEDVKPLEQSLESFPEIFDRETRTMMASKLGLVELYEDDAAWFEELYRLLQQAELDMTLFFRLLADVALEAPSVDTIRPAFYDPELGRGFEPLLKAWLDRYAARVKRDATPASARRARMNAANPKYILRNYLAQEAIDLATEGDYSRITTLLEALRRPYDEQPEHAQLAAKRPDWARHKVGCSMLSCSS